MLGLIRKFAQWPWPLARAVEEQVSDIWAQFRFENNEAVNEVNEVPATLIGATTVTDGKLVTGNSVDTDMQFPVVLFKQNEDFTIEGECTINTLNSGGADLLMASWTVSTDPGAHWSVVRIPGTGKWNFWYNGALRLEAATPTGLGKQHVAVTRKDGVMRLYVNGKLEATTTFAAGNTQNASTVPVRLRVNNTTQFINGTRDNLRIAKVCLYETDFTPASLSEYSRASYSQAKAASVLAQYGFRRNSLINEAPAAQTAVLTGSASVTNGRVKTTNTNADQYSFPVEYFGAADFTIEFMFKLSANRNATMQILGQAYSGGMVSADNSWNIYYQNGQLGVAFWPSTLSSTYSAMTAGSLVVGEDSHIVVERVSDVITVYVNGVARGTMNWLTPLYRETTNTMTSNNKIAGATGIFGEREIWNIRVASTALYKGEVKTKPTFPAFPVTSKDPWYQFLFRNNTVYDEVTGKPVVLSNSSVVDGKLVTNLASNSKASFGEFEVGNDENFTIELKVNITSIGLSGALLLGVWNDGLTNNSWILFLQPNLSLLWRQSSLGNNTSAQITTPSLLQLNKDHHVVVTRHNGKTTIFVDGKASGTIIDNSAFYNSTLPVAITYAHNDVWMSGRRWDIRLVRGEAKYTADFTPAPLTTFQRVAYSDAELANVLRQFTFRDGRITDDIQNTQFSIGSAVSLANGYAKFPYSTSNRSMQFANAYFGAADFTVEFKISITQKSSYFYVLAKWYGGGSTITHASNSWGTYIADDMKPAFLFRDGSVQAGLTSDIPLSYNKEHHVVVERVDGVISIYVDGILGKSANYPQVLLDVTGNILNWATGGAGGYAAYSIWDIRIANAGMYRGKVPRVNYLPRIAQEASADAFISQTLVQDTIPVVKSDHGTDALLVQTLVTDTPNNVKSDHGTDAFIIQTLVKV